MRGIWDTILCPQMWLAHGVHATSTDAGYNISMEGVRLTHSNCLGQCIKKPFIFCSGVLLFGWVSLIGHGTETVPCSQNCQYLSRGVQHERRHIPVGDRRQRDRRYRGSKSYSCSSVQFTVGQTTSWEVKSCFVKFTVLCHVVIRVFVVH